MKQKKEEPQGEHVFSLEISEYKRLLAHCKANGFVMRVNGGPVEIYYPYPDRWVSYNASAARRLLASLNAPSLSEDPIGVEMEREGSPPMPRIADADKLRAILDGGKAKGAGA